MRLAPVVLDEPATDAEPVRPTRWTRRRAWGVVAAVVAVTLGLVGAQRALDARERARLAYLAGVPGVLHHVDLPARALWQWTPQAGVPVADDDAGRWAVGARYHPGGVDLRGTDPATGAELWSQPFSLDAALPPGGRSEFPSVRVRCSTVRPTGAPVVVCAAEVAPVATDGTATPLLVLDPITGSVLATPVVAPGSRWVATGTRLVVATPTLDGAGGVRWDLTATDPSTGSVQWRRRTDVVPQVHEVRFGDQRIRSAPDLSADEDRLLLTDSGHAWLFAADGTPRGDVTVATDGWAELARAGTLVWTPWQTFAVPAGLLVTRDGTRVSLAGSPTRLAVDDGTAPDVVLLSDPAGPGTALVAHDAVTGAELWRSESLAGRPVLVDGVVHAVEGTAVVARDARTGAVRWRARLGSTPAYLGTDGSAVVALTSDGGLHVLALADGRAAPVTDVADLAGAGSGAGARVVERVVEQVAEQGDRLLVRFTDGSGVVLG